MSKSGTEFVSKRAKMHKYLNKTELVASDLRQGFVLTVFSIFPLKRIRSVYL